MRERRWKGARLAVAVALTALVAACATRALPPVPVSPAHPEFPYPTVAEGTKPDQVTRIERGWRYLQADNFRNAEREFQAALKAQPGFTPAEAALGFVALAQKDAKNAVARFERALQSQSDYVPALVGRGQAFLTLNRDAEALASFEAALGADPSLTDVRSRVDVLRVRAMQANLARAKAAADARRWDEARAAYTEAIAASPDSAFLYRDLAIVERRAGEQSLALEHFRRALELDPSDARSQAEIGGILQDQGDLAGAVAAYEKARSLDRESVDDKTLAAARERLSLSKLPRQYKEIPGLAAVTRGDIAALIGIRLERLLAAARQRQVVITDARTHWAAAWIGSTVRAGAMEPLPNYTFDPNGRVRRSELAQTVARVLNLIAAQKPSLGKTWQGARVKVGDVPPGHLLYPAVSLAVASGVMSLDERGNFNLLRPVSGEEAVAAIERLEKLARP